jgi:hypothetical protein
MEDLAKDPEPYLAAAATMLRAEGMLEAANLHRDATPRVEEEWGCPTKALRARPTIRLWRRWKSEDNLVRAS